MSEPSAEQEAEFQRNKAATIGELRELLEYAWTIICNAGEGSWERESADWQMAAAKFRDEYHATLAALPQNQEDGDGFG